jgi:DNA mismatch endonuclease (patch repair protein)
LRSRSPSGLDDPAVARSGLSTYGGPNFRGRDPSSQLASRRMARTGQRDTKPEIALRRLLHERGMRYRVDRSVLPGVRRRGDVVFGPSKVIVFVDGCFWHGCPDHATWPAHNAEFWREKIETNRLRDRDTDERLTKAGWKVVRVWEHESPAEAADRVEQLVRVA